MSETPWRAAAARDRIADIEARTGGLSGAALLERIERLATRSRDIHTRDCFNLNPATNVMNPRAEAMLSAGLGTRASLGHAGDKYETGLEAIEEIEAIAEGLVRKVFGARFAELRVPSGSIANLMGFMATCQPGDTIIVPPASIGGHVTHHDAGAAGLFGLRIVPAPVDADGFSVDLDRLAALARTERPRLITLGGSLNLFEHPVAEVRAIADDVGARLMFDAAHQCGIIAGGAWQNPLAQGAHLMTMSTYKSLGGPPGGLIVTDEAELAGRLDAIAYPGLTANSDAGRIAALGVTMLDWIAHGVAYADAMIAVARGLAEALAQAGLPVFAADRGATRSHQFALKAASFGGGQTAARNALRPAGFLACGIGLPMEEVAGDLNGLRIGTPEIVRFGVTEADIPELADLIARALHSDAPEALAAETRDLRALFKKLHYLCVH